MTDQLALNNLNQVRLAFQASGADHEALKQTLEYLQSRLQKLAELESAAPPQ